MAHSHKHLFLTLASAGQLGRLCLSHRSALSGSVPHVSHSSRTVVYLGGHVLLLTMATVQEGNSKCTGTFQALPCSTSVNVPLAKASHMVKTNVNGWEIHTSHRGLGEGNEYLLNNKIPK